MHSVRNKLFLIFAASMAALIACFYIVSAIFIEDFYVMKNSSIFMDQYRIVQETYTVSPGDVSRQLKSIDRTLGIHGIVIDLRLNVIYDSFPDQLNIGSRKVPADMAELVNTSRRKVQGGGYVYGVYETSEYDKEIIMIRTLDEQHFLIFRKPLAAINESTRIANNFFMVIGIIIFALGSVIIYFFSRRMTDPIVTLSRVARSIANLDFKKRFETESKDEIGQLGESINLISEKLSSTIDNLMLANQKLQKDLDHEKRLDEERREFIRSISHELKTPVGVIKGYAEGIKYGIAMKAGKTDKYLDGMIDECDRADSMIRGLLELSRMESGTQKPDITRFDLNALIQGLIDKYSQIMADKGIKVEFKPDIVYYAYGDAPKIEQVFGNYLINAVEHVDENKLIQVSISSENGCARIGVYNTGSHIPEEEMEQIWKVFYKVNKARTRTFGGSGIGLSIVKSIMELHNSKYGVRNVDSGVEFFFYLKSA